jgi:hypothetical protein
MLINQNNFKKTVPNAHAPTEDKRDGSKDSFHEKIEQIFDNFPKNDMNILLRNFSTKLWTSTKYT